MNSSVEVTTGALLEEMRAPAITAVESGDVPGVVTLVWQDGRVHDVCAVGVADVAKRRRMERSAIFPIASMSKPITVAVALRLLDEGKLRLEDSITKWAPEFAEMRVLRNPEGPLGDTYPAPRAITIEDLMTHRSGLTYGPTSRGPLAAALTERFGFAIDSALDPDTWLRELAKFPLACAPGERFEYGHSIDVLGLIVGRAAGKSFQDALREELLAPLGMTDTGFWVPSENRDRLVAATISAAPGRFMPSGALGYTAPSPLPFASGGQGMVSTVDDYLAFARMLIRGGESEDGRLLRAETVRLMTTNRLTPHQRRLPFMGTAFFADQGFGLGVSMILEAADDSPRGAGDAGAFGWPGAFGGWWQADPARDLVLIWLQACVPPPPQGGIPHRMPGAIARAHFQRAAYSSFEAKRTPSFR